MKDKQRIRKRILALLLSLAMIITYMPTYMLAYAESDENQPAAAEEVTAEKSAVQEETKEEVVDETANDSETPEKSAEGSAETNQPTEPAVENKDSKAEETSEKAGSYGGKYSGEAEGVTVDVITPDDAFAEKVELVVKKLDKELDKEEFEKAEEALAESKQTYDGMLAFDIHFENSKGKEIEPNGTVSVKMAAKKEVLKDIDPEGVVLDSVAVTHIGSEETEVVADTYSKEMTGIEGTVDVTTTSDEVKSIDASFDVESFSTFTITWTNASGDTESANVHWGYGAVQADGSLANEFDAAVLDTTAASISLANTYDGYYCIGAYYLADGVTVGIDIDSVLTKVANGWETTATIHNSDDTTTKEEHHMIPDGAEIYVIYGSKSDGTHPVNPNPDTEAKPQVNKTVTANPDGTRKIRLEVTAPVKDETHQTGANVLIIFDRTQSMSNRMGNRTRLQVAKAAVATLVEALDCDTNDIQLAFVPFASTGTQVRTNGELWTSDGDAFVQTVNGTGQQSGTNWESGLYYGRQTLNSRDTDATYVIFLTDGEPNRRGTTSAQNANTATAISYALTQAQAITGLDNVHLYGIFCGSDSGYNNLANMITNAGGVETINGTNEEDIEEAFSNIASTIIDHLGSSNYSLDDGIPTLSGISAAAMVSGGDVDGFTYEIKGPNDDDFSTWSQAPGASYSADNGVTWDLTKAGTLASGTTYALEFTVWPSQEAYDLIANLNNGLVSWDDEEAVPASVKAQINKDGNTYSLKTNTHLNQSYTFNGQSFNEPVTFTNGSMPLVSYEMDVFKEWDDSINPRNRTDKVDFYLLVDGKYYQNDGSFDTGKDDAYILETSKDTTPAWYDSVQIAPGFATKNDDGTLDVKETGHKYQLEEIPSDDPDYEGYSQEFTTQTVRPMVINGTLTNLVLIDEDNPKPDGATTYPIGEEEEYYVSGTASSSITGTNHKTAELDITKKIDSTLSGKSEAQLNEETFTYDVTFNVPAGGDVSGINYWIYEADNSGWTLPEYDSTGLGKDYAPFGHSDGKKYNGVKSPTTASGQTVTATVTIKRGQVVRFTNLPTGTTYTIVETKANGEALTDQGYTVKSVNSTNGTAGTETIANDKVTGEIEQNNTRYYNQFENKLQAVDAELKVTKDMDYDWDNGDDSYEFTLTATGDAPLPYKDASENNKVTVSSASELTKTFGSIRFTAEGTYTYTITETDGQNPAIVYGGPATVTVTVVKNADGTLTVSKIEGSGTEVKTVFTAASGGKDASANTTIKNKWATKSLSGTKTWNVGEETVREQIKIDIKNGSTVVKTIVINADGTCDDPNVEVTVSGNNWSFTVNNLLAYGEQGEPINYTIAEQALVNYSTSYSADGLTIINTPLITVDATKEWKNADGSTTAPDNATVTFTLNKNGQPTDYTVTLDGTAETTVPTGEGGYESAAWKASFVNLLKYDADGNKINYTVEETTTYPGYTASPSTPVSSGGTITNSQDETDADATKAWKNADGSTTAPSGASVEFTLYADGSATSYKVTLDGTAETTAPTVTGGYESAAWTATFVHLPMYKADGKTKIVYTVAETGTYAGYTASPTTPVADGGTITNTQEGTGVDATKAWKNADGSTTAPSGASVEFTLYADGSATSYKVTLDGTAETTAPTVTGGYESAAWTATFVHLPMYKADGKTKIVYTVAETGTYAGYTASPSTPVSSGGTITNSQDETDADATKAWKNADGSTTAPSGASVEFTLYADGSATSYKVTLDGTAETTAPTVTGGYESAAWTATFVHLPMYKADGKTKIVYTVAETGTYAGYTASPTTPVADGGTITNSQDETDADATKAWKNADGSTTAPSGASVEFTLIADGMATNYKVTLDGTAETTAPTATGGYESAAWTATFIHLPMYKADGKTKIVYTVAETGTYAGYTASPTDPVGDGGTITNSQDETDADATKAWKNADGSTTAPSGASVEFTLYADGSATSYKVTLDGTAETTAPTVTGGYESAAWTATFVHLPMYKADGKTKIVYTVAETGTYAGYTASPTGAVASGKTITNSQETTTATATKAWKNADGSTTAPEGGSVVFTLVADGEDTTYTVTLNGTVDETVPTVTGGYESAAWVATFVSLPKYKVDGKTEIVYTVKETGKYTGFEPDTTDPVSTGGKITNIQEKVDIVAEKTWDDENDKYKLRPTSITINLYKKAAASEESSDTGEETGEATGVESADDKTLVASVKLDGTVDTATTATTGNREYEAWKAIFPDLPRYEGEQEIEYIVEEAEVANYTAEVKGPEKEELDPVVDNKTMLYTYSVTNTLDKVDLEITKDLHQYVDHNSSVGGNVTTTFVFEIKGKKGNTVVYTKQVGIQLSGAGTETKVIKNVPKGLTYTVEEVYWGSYDEPANKQKPAVLTEDGKKFTVKFDNSGDNIEYGGGVINKYTPNEEGDGFVNPPTQEGKVKQGEQD